MDKRWQRRSRPGPHWPRSFRKTRTSRANCSRWRKIIQVRGALGLQRQIFFVSMGGFDTHSDQLAQQDSLFNDLNQSMSAFYQATTEMGVANNVTTFTLSDFGRTYSPEQRWHRPRLGQPSPDHGRSG